MSERTDPLVSVVIPTFNQAGFLDEALRSVTGQTFQNWEAIVLNNFSTDNTVSIVEQIRDPRIRILDFANGGVIAKSRNKGIQLSAGKYVAFLDSDDVWEPNKLARSIELLEKGSDLVCHAERWFGGGMRDRVVKYGPESRADYTSLLVEGNCISTSTVVMRRETLVSLGGFSERKDFVTTEDYDLWLRTSRSGFRVSFTDEVLGSFRRHTSSASSSTLRHLAAELAVLENHFQSVDTNLRMQYRRRKGLAYYTAARAFTRHHNFREGFVMFVKAIALSPRRVRCWVGLSVHLFVSIQFLTKKLNRHA